MITQYLFVQAYIVLWGIHDCEHRYYKNTNSSLPFFLNFTQQLKLYGSLKWIGP